MSFSSKLKEARLRSGLTQQDIANKLNIDKSTYSGYETGKREPFVERIKELASILGVSGDYLLEINDDAPEIEKAITFGDGDFSFSKIATQLKNARIKAGISVKRARELLLTSFGIDISTKTIYGYESGLRQPDIHTLLAFCLIYKIEDILSHFGLKNEKTSPEQEALSEVINKSDIIQDIIRLLTELPPEFQAAALEQLRTLSSIAKNHDTQEES